MIENLVVHQVHGESPFLPRLGNMKFTSAVVTYQLNPKVKAKAMPSRVSDLAPL